MTWQEFRDEVERQIAELPEEQRVAEIWYIDIYPTENNPPTVSYDKDSHEICII